MITLLLRIFTVYIICIGDPKGIQRPTGGHIVSLSWVMKNIYAMKEGERWLV